MKTSLFWALYNFHYIPAQPEFSGSIFHYTLAEPGFSENKSTKPQLSQDIVKIIPG